MRSLWLAALLAKGNASHGVAGVLLGVGLVAFYLWAVHHNRTK